MPSRRNWLIDLRPCQYDDGYLDGRSQIKVHTDERTQVLSAQFSLLVTHPSTNRAQVTEQALVATVDVISRVPAVTNCTAV